MRAYHQSEPSCIDLKEKDADEQVIDPINNEGETAQTLEGFSHMVGVYAIDEKTVRSTAAVSLDHQQLEIWSINLKEVCQEKHFVLLRIKEKMDQM